MANFFIQTDKEFYFSGDTVNGNIFCNVGAFITGASGISMKFTGYQCVKWVQARQLHRPTPHNDPNRPQPIDPIEQIDPRDIYHTDEPIAVSDPESEDDRSYDHRPKYIRNSNDQYFEMKYFETRNMFTKMKVMLYHCQGFQPGQYSFPFSFKTFEGWPASFSHLTQRKKGVIIYHMQVAIEPQTPKFLVRYSQEITLRETRAVVAQHKSSRGEITNCCCLSKGMCSAELHFQKDGYMPGELVQMIIEIDNSQCQANINWINISVDNTVTMRSSGQSTSDHRNIFHKQINGVPARLSQIGQQAIRQAFTLNSGSEIKPTCSGKLLSSDYTLSIKMEHDINCQCCSDIIGSSIPVIIFPIIRPYAMPQMFQSNWAPQQMPVTDFTLPNNFQNFSLNNMGGGQQYPPQQAGYPQGQQGQGQMQQQQQQQQQQGQMGYPPQQQQQQQQQGQMGYPPQQQQQQQSQFDNSGMQMQQNMRGNTQQQQQPMGYPQQQQMQMGYPQ